MRAATGGSSDESICQLCKSSEGTAIENETR
jgi:hypothetical protein